MIVPDRIGHVVIKVRDLERSKKFYTEVLGLTQMMEIPVIKMAFFASNARDHHELACVEVGADAPGPRKGEIGLVHIAFRLRDEDHLRAAHAELKRLGVPIISTVDHGVSMSIYFRDPDDHQIEVYCDGTPEHRAQFANDYMGSGKLEFAKDEPGIGALVKGLTS